MKDDSQDLDTLVIYISDTRCHLISVNLTGDHVVACLKIDELVG